MITDTLDGHRKSYNLTKASKDECLEDLKERGEQGNLNPVLPSAKAPKKIDDFFKSKPEFLKRQSD